MPAIVASENTTPNPNVSSGRFRSITRIWCRGSAFFISAAKYRPPGPPPTQTMRITASRGVRPGHGHRGSGEHRENEPQRHRDTEVLCASVSPWLNYPLRARAGSVNAPGRSGAPPARFSSQELRWPLRDEGVVRFAEISVRHQRRLNLSFRVERGVQVHARFAVERVFGDLERERRSLSELRGEGCRRGEHVTICNHTIVQPDAEGFVRRDEVAGQQQLRGAPAADDPWQQPRGTHVGAGEADFREEERDSRGCRGTAHVARRRNHGAGAGGGAVEGGDDRPAALPDGENQIACHPRELEQAAVVARKERSDDVAHVAAGAERLPGAGDDDRTDHSIVVDGAEGLTELVVDVERERVEPIGPIECDRGDAGGAITVVQERRWRHGTTAMASISTSASSSRRAVTCTSVIDG